MRAHRYRVPGRAQTTCDECGARFWRRVGVPGRPQTICSDECRRARDRRRDKHRVGRFRREGDR